MWKSLNELFYTIADFEWEDEQNYNIFRQKTWLAAYLRGHLVVADLEGREKKMRCRHEMIGIREADSAWYLCWCQASLKRGLPLFHLNYPIARHFCSRALHLCVLVFDKWTTLVMENDIKILVHFYRPTICTLKLN